MKNEWRIRSPWDEIRLVAASRASADERKSAMPPRNAAQRLRLALAGDQSASRRLLIAILSEIEGSSGLLTRTSTDWLLSRVERAVRDGRILAIASTFAGGSGILKAEEEEGAGETGPKETVPAKDWIEIQILDYNDKPLAGHPYKLELPDGSVREGTVGADGLARVDGIDPGTCKLTWKRQRIAKYHLEEVESGEKTA